MKKSCSMALAQVMLPPFSQGLNSTWRYLKFKEEKAPWRLNEVLSLMQ